ncbi:MAG: hypothetical protein GC136_10685 [Alphaproteobacteria bacterium]|nr:hypothetical protein [Alphaproteobacteria bacterium]
MKKPFVKGAAILVIAVLFLFASVSESFALRLTAKRIIFEGKKRAEDIVIINKSEKAETYRVGWRPMKMMPDGSLEPDKSKAGYENDPYDVSNMIKFAPRRFTIPPNGSQQLRIMLRLPADLPDGEYRNHLFIDTENLGNTLEENQKRGVTLIPKPGATIPIFVRKGDLSYKITVNSVEAKSDGNDILFTYSLTREGNRGLYLRTELICNANSAASYPLKSIKGMGFYTDQTVRSQVLRIPKIQGRPACQTVKARFYEDGKEDNKLLSEQTATVYN